MEGIEVFKNLHEVTGDIVAAYESEDEKALESAMGRFLLLAMQTQALK